MVDSFANTYSSHDIARALESTNQAIRWAEGIIECKWAVELVAHAHRALVEIDEQVAKKRAEIAETGQKLLDDRVLEGNKRHGAIITEAKVKAREIIDGGNARLAEVEAAIETKAAELAKVTADFDAMRNKLRDHAEQVQRITG
jgi:uncharacterized coiled-coil protein SlyX